MGRKHIPGQASTCVKCGAVGVIPNRGEGGSAWAWDKNRTTWVCRQCKNRLQRERYQRHPEAVLRRTRRYKATLRGAYNTLRRRAEQRGIPFLLSEERFAEIKVMPCVYCSVTPDEALCRYGKRMTIDRVDSSRGYEDDNCAPACHPCNEVKSDFWTAADMFAKGAAALREHHQRKYGLSEMFLIASAHQ